MKTFKNKNFTKRDYEATNVVACQGTEAPNDNWQETDEPIIAKLNLQRLWIENGIQYYGWL